VNTHNLLVDKGVRCDFTGKTRLEADVPRGDTKVRLHKRNSSTFKVFGGTLGMRVIDADAKSLQSIR
jgi:hypothetical protein